MQPPNEQAAATFAAGLVLVRAIELANSLDTDDVAIQVCLERGPHMAAPMRKRHRGELTPRQSVTPIPKPLTDSRDASK